VGFEQCRAEQPQLTPIADGHLVSCWRA
jgi:hypothetical protein